jgi:hypothetical protein
MLYILEKESFYTENDLENLFLRVKAVRSNTNGYFDKMKFPALMYAFYLYAPFDYTTDWRKNADIFEKKLIDLIKNEATSVSFLCLKLIGRNIPQISGEVSVIGYWDKFK